MNESYLPPSGVSPQPGDPPPLRRRGTGCFATGCIVVVILCAVLFGLLGGLGWYLYSNARPFVSSQPAAVQTYPATEDQYRALVDRFQTFLNKFQTERHATLELSADDLNTCIARAPDAQNLRGKVFFAIADNQLTIDASLPLPSQSDSPGQTVYYFNGRTYVSASFAEGDFAFDFHKLETLDGKPAPALVSAIIENPGFSRSFNRSFNESFRKQINRNPNSAEAFGKLRTILIQNNKLVVTAADDLTPAAR